MGPVAQRHSADRVIGGSALSDAEDNVAGGPKPPKAMTTGKQQKAQSRPQVVGRDMKKLLSGEIVQRSSSHSLDPSRRGDYNAYREATAIVRRFWRANRRDPRVARPITGIPPPCDGKPFAFPLT